jgi:hypothetical protein
MKRNVPLGVIVLAFLVSLATSWLVTGPMHLLASQGAASLPTTGVYNGLTAANDVNAAVDAVLTCNEGPSAPTNALGGAPKAGQCWLDNTSSTLKIKKRYSGSGWVVEGVIDVTNGVWVPVSGGGSGAVASSGTTDLCASPQVLQTVSGTTTITSFGSNCVIGVQKTLVFSGILTLTYNGSSLIIPGAASKTTAAGDVAFAVYAGSGNWRVLSYIPISGTNVTAIDSTTGAFTIGGLLSRASNLLQVLTAAKTDQQSSTSNALAVTPLHQQDHPSAAKAWVYTIGTTIQSSYGVSSITKTGVGNYVVNFSTAFTLAPSCTGIAFDSSVGLIATANSVSGVTFNIIFRATSTGAFTDPGVGFMVNCFGPQ